MEYKRDIFLSTFQKIKFEHSSPFALLPCKKDIYFFLVNKMNYYRNDLINSHDFPFCSICLGPIKKKCCLNCCKHSFYSNGIKKLIKYNSICPLYRKQINIISNIK